MTLLTSETDSPRCFAKSFINSQNSQENTCVGSLFNKAASCRPTTLSKIDSDRLFSCEFCKKKQKKKQKIVRNETSFLWDTPQQFFSVIN